MNTSTAHIFRFCPRTFSDFVRKHFQILCENIFNCCPRIFSDFAPEISFFSKLKHLVDTYSPTPTLICWDLSFPNLVCLKSTNVWLNWSLTLDILICYTTSFYFVSNVSTVQNIMTFYLVCLLSQASVVTIISLLRIYIFWLVVFLACLNVYQYIWYSLDHVYVYFGEYLGACQAISWILVMLVTVKVGLKVKEI